MQLSLVVQNVGWFRGWPVSERTDGVDPTVLAALSALYTDFNVDALCLQEMPDEDAAQRLADSLSMAWAYCPGMEQKAYGGGVLWRKGQLLADARGAAPPPARCWQLLELQTGPYGGITVANVHLVSDKRTEGGDGEARRVADMRQVVGLDPRPALICGDLNEEPGGPVGELLTDAGYLDAAVEAGAPAGSTGIAKPRSDQVWLD
jgi:endonuclease/exonuclease/phosphatase family metal-dependent hydrolase